MCGVSSTSTSTVNAITRCCCGPSLSSSASCRYTSTALPEAPFTFLNLRFHSSRSQPPAEQHFGRARPALLLLTVSGVHAPLPIGYVMTSFESGGTERQMVELLRRLDPARWQVHVACFHAKGRWLGAALEKASTLVEFPLRSFRRPETARRALNFAGWCRQHRLAVVHTSDLYANVFALPLAALARVPVRIANRREILADKTPAQLYAQRAAYSFAH